VVAVAATATAIAGNQKSKKAKIKGERLKGRLRGRASVLFTFSHFTSPLPPLTFTVYLFPFTFYLLLLLHLPVIVREMNDKVVDKSGPHFWFGDSVDYD
jgi:hypothetical protein